MQDNKNPNAEGHWEKTIISARVQQKKFIILCWVDGSKYRKERFETFINALN